MEKKDKSIKTRTPVKLSANQGIVGSHTKNKNDEIKKVTRIEIRLNENLAEALRTCAFEKRITKKAVIVDALTDHLTKTGYLNN